MKQKFFLLMLCLSSTGLFAQNAVNGGSSRSFGNTSWVSEGIAPGEVNGVKMGLRADNGGSTEESDYSKGVFILNEDWYGHQNSTINYLTPEGEWVYHVFQKENPGHELGCTSQYGVIYGGKMYIVSKQQRDPGAKITGSRFAICDAKTMKVEKEFQYIATKTVQGSQGQDSLVSIADGRSYLPVDNHKGYIGTSNGIWVYDSDKQTIGGQIAGSGNPNSTGYGNLYYAQVGTMLRSGDYVFAVHQQYGLLVIDAKTDKLVKTIAAPKEIEKNGDKEKEVQRGFGSIVKAKDGSLWISMTKNTLGDGNALKYMLKFDPVTFKADTIRIPLDEKGIGLVPNSWYAWTADGFCASAKENKIYWNGQPAETGSWFTGYQIFSYDIDKKEFALVFDVEALPGEWRLYGTGFRIHPVTDELYCFLYHTFQDPTHMLVRVSPKGKLLQEYPMIVNYWFPALPIFPQSDEAPVATDKIQAPEAEVSVYPNPATDYVTISGEGLQRVEIYSLGGALQLDRKLTTPSSVDIRHLPKGLYVVKVTTAGGTAIRKLIKR